MTERAKRPSGRFEGSRGAVAGFALAALAALPAAVTIAACGQRPSGALAPAASASARVGAATSGSASGSASANGAGAASTPAASVTSAPSSSADAQSAQSAPIGSAGGGAEPLTRLLGSPCDAPAARDVGSRCGADGRVVGFYRPVDVHITLPGERTLFAESPPLDAGPRAGSREVVASGEVLEVRVVTCGRCRRILGWAFRGYPARMTDAERLELQDKLGVSPAVPLRSVAEWEHALAPGAPGAPAR